jgi:hypothetical protein
VAYDPGGNKNSALVPGQKVRFAATAQECIEQAAVVVLVPPWCEFRRIPPEQWARHTPSRTFIYCWRVLKHLNNYRGLHYVPLGTGDIFMKCSQPAGTQILVQR